MVKITINTIKIVMFHFYYVHDHDYFYYVLLHFHNSASILYSRTTKTV